MDKASPRERDSSEFVSGLICVVLSLVLAVAILWASWLKWPDGLVDYGRELYVPWQILEGKILYRDLFFMYGPLAQHLNAFLFWFFGMGLSTLVTFNLGCILVLCLAIGYLQFRMFGWFSAGVSLLVFIGVFAFGHYGKMGNFNFITPYSHDAIYGLELSLLMFVCLWRIQDRPGNSRMATLGIVMGLILLTKVEVILSAWSAAMLFLAVRAWDSVEFRRLSLLVAWLLGVLLAPAGFFCWFMAAEGPTFAFSAILTTFSSPFVFSAITKNVLYQQLSGFAEPGLNLLTMIFVGFLELLVAGLGILLSRMSSVRIQAAGVAVVAASLLVLFVKDLFPAFVLLRPLPIALAALVLWWNVKKPLLAAFSLFSLLLLLKILLNASVFSYGFFLAMPGTIFLTGWLVSHKHWVPRLFAGLCILLFMVMHLNLSWSYLGGKNCPVTAGRDLFFTYDEPFPFSQGKVYRELIPWLTANTGADDGLVVIPEGVILNYLARRHNPGKLFEFSPSLIEAMGEKQVLQMLQVADPKYVAIPDRETMEFGVRFFGKDFGREIAAWIHQNYTSERVFGAEPMQGKGFGVEVFKRNRSGL